MKKFFALLALSVASFGMYAQEFSEGFEGYEPFSKVAANSPYFRTWGSEYRPEADAIVSTARARSGEQSMYLYSNSASGGPIDAVLDFGGTYTAGSIVLDFWMLIREKTGGYFNLQGTQRDGESTLASCYIHDDSVYFYVGDETYYGVFKPDVWQQYSFRVDLTTNSWILNLDGEKIAEFKTDDAENKWAGVDFYPLNNSTSSNKATCWVDDISFKVIPIEYPNTNLLFKSASASGGRLTGTSTELKVVIANESKEVVEKLELAYTYNGDRVVETFDKLSIYPGVESTLTFSKQVTLSSDDADVDFEIVSYNNKKQDDDLSDNEMVAEVGLVIPNPQKMVLIEEGTGTWCPWCTRGTHTLDMLDKLYKDYATSIAVHFGDPMQPQFYGDFMNENYFSGYPSGTINRTHSSGMGLPETEHHMFNEMTKAPASTFKTAAELSGNTLNVTVTYEMLSDVTTDWLVACALIENGVTGEGSNYAQANAYAGGANGPMGGFENKPNLIPAEDMVYDHVGRAISPNSIGASAFTKNYSKGESASFTFTFNLRDDWNQDELKLIPILMRADSSIDNVDRVSLKDALDGTFEEADKISGVSEWSEQNLTVFPNPASSHLIVRIDEPIDQGQLHLVNMQGQVVWQNNDAEMQWSVDVSNLPKGAYTLLLTSENQQSRKMVIVE